MNDDSRVVLVTGAGGGLGQAICRRFLTEDWQVVATDVTTDALAGLEDHAGLHKMALDVTSTDAARAAAGAISQHYGRLDAVINNAGIMGYFPVVESDPDTIVRHFQINCFGALRVTHACLELLMRSQGKVINISSESQNLRSACMVYQATKQSLEGLSDVMRRELVHLGIGLCTVRPGAIDTELFHAMSNISNPVPDGRLAETFQKFVEFLQKHPPTRLSSPDEVAALVYRVAMEQPMRPHYEINNMISLKVMSLLPTGWADAIMNRMLRTG